RLGEAPGRRELLRFGALADNPLQHVHLVAGLLQQDGLDELRRDVDAENEILSNFMLHVQLVSRGAVATAASAGAGACCWRSPGPYPEGFRPCGRGGAGPARGSSCPGRRLPTSSDKSRPCCRS